MDINREIPAYGDLFTLDEWRSMTKQGAIIPYDGTGYQGTAEGYDNTLSAFAPIVEGCTHIMWFNK